MKDESGIGKEGADSVEATNAMEATRAKTANRVNAVEGSRFYLEALHGRVWNTKELIEDFEVLSFMAPFVAVRRKADGATGSLMFQHKPRFYFSFEHQ